MHRPRKDPVLLTTKTAARCKYDVNPSLKNTGTTLQDWKNHNKASTCMNAPECLKAASSRNLDRGTVIQDCLKYADLGQTGDAPLNEGQIENIDKMGKNVVAVRKADGSGVTDAKKRNSDSANPVAAPKGSINQLYYSEVKRLGDYVGTTPKHKTLLEELRTAATEKLNACSIRQKAGYKQLYEGDAGKGKVTTGGCLALDSAACQQAGNYCELTPATACSKFKDDQGKTEECAADKNCDESKCIEWKKGNTVVLKLTDPTKGQNYCYEQDPRTTDKRMLQPSIAKDGKMLGTPTTEECDTKYRATQTGPEGVRLQEKKDGEWVGIDNVPFSSNYICSFSAPSLHAESVLGCKMKDKNGKPYTKQSIKEFASDISKLAKTIYSATDDQLTAMDSRLARVKEQNDAREAEMAQISKNLTAQQNPPTISMEEYKKEKVALNRIDYSI